MIVENEKYFYILSPRPTCKKSETAHIPVIGEHEKCTGDMHVTVSTAHACIWIHTIFIVYIYINIYDKPPAGKESPVSIHIYIYYTYTCLFTMAQL